MQRPTGPTLEGQPANLRRPATANPAFKPEFARSVRMHPVLAAAVASAVIFLMILLAMNQKPLYSAESLIYIEPFSSKVLADGTSGTFDSTKYESSLAQQMLTAQRSDILVTALNTLPRQVWASYGPTPQIAATVLQSQMKVARVSTSYQVSISLKGPDAANTAAIVNAVTTAYLEAGRKDEISQADQRSQLLSEERSRIEQELAKTRAEQTQLGATLGIANPGAEGGNPFDSQLEALRAQLVTARASHDQAAAQLAAISGLNTNHASGLTAAANDIIGSDPGLGSMKSTINQRRAQLSSQMAGLTPGNPIYKQDQDELADLDKTLDSMTVQLRDRAARSLQDKLRTELERTSDVEGRINGELAHQTATATSASPRLQRAAELAADVQRLNLRYATVDNALHSLQLETTGPGMAHLALAASVPAAPEPTKKRLILLAAMPVGFLWGLVAAIIARKRDFRIYNANDVEEVLGFGTIAVLPARSEVSEDVLDEYTLRLAAGVEGAYRSGNARTFVITPVSTETDIAPLVKALDRKLVELGLGVVILGAATVFEQHYDAPATSELAGYDGAHSDPNYDRRFEGLASTLFNRMKAEHDVILLESPALLISAQTEYVARCSDVTLLVVESAVTTRGELFQAGALLQRLNVTGVGSVLEQLNLRFADSTFRKGVRALEGRTRTVRRPAPAREAEPVTAPEPVYAAAAKAPEPVRYQVPVEQAAPVAVVEDHAPEPTIVEDRTERSWYPVHAVAPPEPATAEPLAALPEANEPVAAPVVEAVAHPVAESVEAEHPAPMGLFDSIEPAQERRKAGSTSGYDSTPETDVDEPQPARNWFKRIFQRDSEPVVSFLPDSSEDDDDEDEIHEPVVAAPLMASEPARYDPSRYDLPLRPETTRESVAATLPEPVAVAAPVAVPEPMAVAAPVFVPAPEPVHAPLAQVVEDPLPEPVAAAPAYVPPAPVAAVFTQPEPVAPVYVAPEPSAPAAVTPPKPVPYVAPAPAASEPEPAVYAFKAAAVAAPVEAVTMPAPAPAALAPAAYAFSAAAVAQTPSQPEPTPVPSSPLSYAELLKLQPAAAAAPVVLTPAPAPDKYSEPVAAKPVPEPTPSSSDDWNPAPLNRWDPIPPLRQQEPWRISSGSTRAAQQQPSAEVWRGEDPVRIPPTDRWVSPEAIAPEAPPAEANDVVLTRRWGLLSRFQQGESFQAAHRSSVRMPEPTRQQQNDRHAEELAQDFGQDYDPEYDRTRR